MPPIGTKTKKEPFNWHI